MPGFGLNNVLRGIPLERRILPPLPFRSPVPVVLQAPALHRGVLHGLPPGGMQQARRHDFEKAVHPATKAPSRFSPLVRRVMSTTPVVRNPGEVKACLSRTFQQALQARQPGAGTAIMLGEGHENIGMLPFYHCTLAMARSSACRALNIKTVLFEFPADAAHILPAGIEKIDRLIARTPGGARAYFNNLPMEERAGAKWFYMISQAQKQGFRVECIDSSSDDMGIRNRTMNARIRKATRHGEGVIVINGAMHVANMQRHLLAGTSTAGGAARHRPVNVASLVAVDLKHPAEVDALIHAYVGERLPLHRSQLVRLSQSMADRA